MSDNGDEFWDNPFGGFFDINGDGKEDLGEQFLAYEIFNEMSEEDDDDLDDYLLSPTVKRHSAPRRPQQPKSHIASSAGRNAAKPSFPTSYITKNQTDTNEITFEEEYRLRKSAVIKDALFGAFLALVACAYFVLAQLSYDGDDGSWLAANIVHVVATLTILFLALLISRKDLLGYNTIKEAYLRSLPEDEKVERKRANVKRISTCIACVGAIICVTVAIIAAVPYATHAFTPQAYSKAEELILRGRYEKAAHLLRAIEGEDYKDTGALLLLCNARLDYRDGLFDEAYHNMQRATFRYQSGYMLNEIERFKEALIESEHTD